MVKHPLSREGCSFFFVCVCVCMCVWVGIRVEVAVEGMSGLEAMFLVSFASVTS